MGLIRSLVYSVLLDRLLRGRRGPGGVAGPRYGPAPYGRPARGSWGLGGPVPHLRGTTRRGTQVRATGCCLPIPLTVLASGVALGLSHHRSGRQG